MRGVFAAALAIAALSTGAARAGTTVLEARPSALDPGVKAFDEPNVVFDQDIPPQFARAAAGPNPHHGLTIRDPRYADDWRALFGAPGPTADAP